MITNDNEKREGKFERKNSRSSLNSKLNSLMNDTYYESNLREKIGGKKP